METKTIGVWYAVDKDGYGYAYRKKPKKEGSCWVGRDYAFCCGVLKQVMPELTWDDEPVKITLQISY